MAGPLLERVWAWIHRTFPERQIYIRSDGRVQFFTFGPSLQATLAGLSLIFLGWVAFATVNVIFKDRIITAKDHRYQQMQSAYENRLADLQISYDELNGALVGAEDKFKATADDLQARQNAISGFLARRQQVGTMAAPPASGPAPAPLPASGDSTAASDMDSEDAPAGAANYSTGAPDMSVSGSSLGMMPGPVAPQPTIAAAPKPAKSSMLENAWTKIRQMASLLLDRRTAPRLATSAAYAQHPALRALAEQTARVAAIGTDETKLMGQTEILLRREIDSMRGTVRMTGINPDTLERKVAANDGVGGPDIPLDQVHVDGITDPAFNTAFLRASAVLDQMNGLSSEMSHIPLTVPVSGAQFDRTSGFGPRIDPFTGRYAFHPGVDFAGPWGAAVSATAPGTVVFAGNRGSYGNMVEIDHGFGLRTRYGHLSAITVSVGMKVAKGATIGKLGSTGRSTGPHVHYEVWFDDVVRNPSNFIEAGRHVL